MGAATYTYPKTNTMNTPSFLFSLLLIGASGAQAQSPVVDVGSLSARPLNLSQRPIKGPVDAAPTVPTQLVPAADQVPVQGVAPLPYGAGFEARTSGSAPGSNSAGAGRSGGTGGGNGGGGGGGGGRGGSGRGR